MHKFLTVCILVCSWPALSQAPQIAEGRTMGTTYRVIYFDSYGRDFQQAIDSLLAVVNRAISTYDPASEISRFNRARRCFQFEGPHLRDILCVARFVNRRTDGAFDPTVSPLIDAWGFGPGPTRTLTPAVIDSLRQLVGFESIILRSKKVCKNNTRVALNMGGIGQGYGADMIFDLLRSHGVSDMLVELGGEGMAWGRNLEKDRPWTIGILDPNATPTHQFFKAYVTLDNQAFTTSGNYFNYRIIDGRKYGHTIDPRSGRPVQHSLLSASVFTADCTRADAWATAFMVLGFEKAVEIVSRTKDLEAVFMYSKEDGSVGTYISPGLADKVTLE